MKISLSILILDDFPKSAVGAVAALLRLASNGKDVTAVPPWVDIQIGSDLFTIQCDLIQSAENARDLFASNDGHKKLQQYDLVLLDNDWEKAKMPGDFGIELLERARLSRGEGPFVAIFTRADTFVHSFVSRAISAGADALVRKDESTHLLNCILAAFERRQKREAWRHWQALGGLFVESDRALISKSPRMTEVLRRLADYAIWPNVPVLLLGRPGTGKTRLARAVHDCSPRAAKPFERVDLGGMNENLVTAELFGADAGAFTGAVPRKGIIELAEGGTVFIDEVQNIPRSVQKSLLGIIAEKTYRRPGSDVERRANVRFIFASNRNLDELVERQELQEDLYHRINVCSVTLPELSERREDIPDLARVFTREFLQDNGIPDDSVVISESAITALVERQWNDNMRGLRNTIWRSLMRLQGNSVLAAQDLDFGSDVSAGYEAFGPRDAIRALKVAPRAGAQRKVFDRLLERAPDYVLDEELRDLLGEPAAPGATGPGQALMQAISRLRNRLREEEVEIVRDPENRGYKLQRIGLG